MTDRNSYKKWTPEEDELLRNLVLLNVAPFDIAAKFGRSVTTVKARAHFLGIMAPTVGNHPADVPGEGEEGEMTGPRPVGRRWTAAEEKQLQEMLDAGMTGAEAATKLERTRQSIYARLQRLYRKRYPSPAVRPELGLKAKK
jgi:hypothetical protein